MPAVQPRKGSAHFGAMAKVMRLIPKNWDSFQHYKDRNPPWIKLHKGLIDDRTYQRLPVASRALAPMLWLLASELKDGSFDGDVVELAFRLRSSEKEVSAGLDPLIKAGFFMPVQDASSVLADCARVAVPETEGETEKEKEAKGDGAAKRRTRLPENFYPDETGITALAATGLSLAVELEKFRNHHKAKGSTMLDWKAAWRTWVGNAPQFQPTKTRQSAQAQTIDALTGGLASAKGTNALALT